MRVMSLRCGAITGVLTAPVCLLSASLSARVRRYFPPALLAHDQHLAHLGR
jgi:hypothetical protein